MTSIQHLLVATDLSEHSERALARALRVAQGGRLTALHVVTAGLPADLAGRWQKDAEAFLAERLGRVSSPGSPDLETVVVAGDPFSAIIGEAAKRQVGLIVMGEPRRQGYADMFTGTTAERVIRFSDRPVLMVNRRDARHASLVIAMHEYYFVGHETLRNIGWIICFYRLQSKRL